MSIDFAKLAVQGRAFSGSRPWTGEELDAVLLLVHERNESMLIAADYVRNGITTLEAYDRAVEAEFKPKGLNDVTIDVEAALKDNEFAVETEEEKPAKKGKKAKPPAEESPVEESPVEEAPAEEVASKE